MAGWREFAGAITCARAICRELCAAGGCGIITPLAYSKMHRVKWGIEDEVQADLNGHRVSGRGVATDGLARLARQPGGQREDASAHRVDRAAAQLQGRQERFEPALPAFQHAGAAA